MDEDNAGIIAFETELGVCSVRWTDAGIASVRLPSARTAAWPASANAPAVPDMVAAAVDGIVRVLDGRPVDFDFVALDARGLGSFRRRVYAATRRIAFGTTASYGEIARSIGRLDREAPREVGSALAGNPFPIIVPCHRVIAASGALTGFSAPGGIATKRRLLELEGAPGFGQQRLFG